MIKISDELKIQIPIEADGSSAARAKFQTSINNIVDKMNTSSVPKIQISVSKINGSEAIAKFKKEIQDAIGGIGAGKKSGSVNISGTNKGIWNNIFKDSVKDLTAKNIDLKPLNNYYKDLEKQGDSFHKKNLNGIDIEIKAREAQGKASSAQIKEQMQEREAAIKQNKKAIAEIQSAAGSKQEQAINSIENAINKLGNTKLLEPLSEVKELQRALLSDISEKGGGGSLNDALQKISQNSGDLEDITIKAKKLNEAVSELHSLSTKENPLFVKNERLADQARDISDFSLSLEKYAKANDKYKNNTGASAEFEKINITLNDLKRKSNLGMDIGIDLDILKKKTNDWKLSLESAGLTGQTAFGKLRAQMEKLGVYMSASAVLMFAVRQIKQMTQNVIELDNSLNSLQMVTGYSNVQMQGLLKTYQGLASELSATTSEVLAGSEVWLRQGRSIAETNELIKTSTVFSKVAMIDAATASDLLTSSINGYGVAAKDAMLIVDALAAVDMAAATSSEEMSVAMQKTAASAKLAGVPMNELIAYIATISETSRASAEIVGTAMKSLFSRITQVKAGKLVDEDGEDISNVSKVLTQYGVAVQNTNGTLRDANVIISELANTWDKLTNAEQQEVAGAVAGLKQKEQFTILMENWERVTKLATVATDSNGYALEKFNVHQESTAAKMAEFQNQFQILSSTIWDSELIKGSIDTGTGFLGILTGIIDTLGTIPTLATVAAGSLSAFSNKGWLKNLSDKRTYALLQSGGNTERADIFSKRLYSKSLKWCA